MNCGPKLTLTHRASACSQPPLCLVFISFTGVYFMRVYQPQAGVPLIQKPQPPNSSAQRPVKVHTTPPPPPPTPPHMQTHTHTCRDTHTHIYADTHMHAHTHTCRHTHARTHTCAHSVTPPPPPPQHTLSLLTEALDLKCDPPTHLHTHTLSL